MRRLTSIVAALALGAPTAAAAAEPPPDLSVHTAPVAHVPGALRIREPAPAATAATVAQTGPPGPPPATSVSSAPPPADSPFGGDQRSLEERVVFRVAGGVALDNTPTSGEPMRNGVTPADQEGDLAVGAQPLRASNSYLLGDAVLGTRGVPVSALNTYFSSQFRLGIDGVSAYATRNDVWDSQADNDILVYSAYAEIDDWGAENDALHPLYVRAGRQFHYGSAMFATQFDGLQLAWEKPDYEVGGFVGRRVAIYLGDDPGIVAGGSARVRFERINGWPLALAFDALSFDGERLFLELGARFEVGPAKLNVTARALDKGGDGDDGGMKFGRLGARARLPVGDKLLVQADADFISADEAAYDYLSPTPTDVVDLGSSGIALALPEPEQAIRLGGGVLVTLAPGLEGYGFARANLSEPGAFDSDWVELGAALEAQMRTGLQAGAEFKVRAHALDDAANDVDQDFDDLAGAGVTGFREGSAELRYRPGYHKYGVTLGVWLRSYDFVTPYVTVDGDTRGGGRADADVWIEKHTRIRVIAEAAQPSPAYSPDLDTQYSVRFLGEASF